MHVISNNAQQNCSDERSFVYPDSESINRNPNKSLIAPMINEIAADGKNVDADKTTYSRACTVDVRDRL